MLSPGSRLGAYEVIGSLGAGGMGEVYRARDTKLGRDVALKVLPQVYAGDTERLARFQREAHVLASLNHPNIAAIHGLDDASGSPALVLELVTGETLAERIARGAMPLAEALGVARQIASALDAAHERGIVHRDLKPANIKVTPDGTVKVLDFGLARLMSPSLASSDAPYGSASGAAATITSPALMTGLGTLLGTAAYMSPEQARGQEADRRSDIWAFGCVFYEMITGRRLFDGSTISDALSNVLTKEPDWTPIPDSIRPLLQSCLERDPRQRLRDIGDAWRLIDRPQAATRRSSVLPIVAAVVAAAALTSMVWVWMRTRPAERALAPSTRVAIDVGPESLIGLDFPSIAISPDGRRVAIVSSGADKVTRLSVRRLDEPAASILPGTEGARIPFFSPDGQSVGFFAGGKLKKIGLDAREPIELCDALAGRGAAWSTDGKIVASLDTREGLALVSPNGGVLGRVTEVAAGELTHRWPQFLPGGNAVLFTVSAVPGNYVAAGIAVASLTDNPGKAKKILLPHAGMAPRYLPTGHIAFVSNGTLHAVPFDLNRLEVTGAAKPVLDDVSAAVAFGSAQFDVSLDGTAVYRYGQTPGRRLLKWLSADGTTEPIRAEPAQYTYPRVSPDGRRVVISVSEGAGQDLWVYGFPVWSPDGQFIVFQSGGQVYWTRADNAQPPQVLIPQTRGQAFPSSFARDGKLLVVELNPDSGSVLEVVPIEVTGGRLQAGQPQEFHRTRTRNPVPAFSPDGRWVAYASSESGVYDVYVRAFPDDGRQVPVSTSGGNFPVWSPTENRLFYRTDDQLIMAVTYSVVDGRFAVSKPQPWSTTRLFNNGLIQNYDVASDGKRFAVLMPDQGAKEQANAGLMLFVNFYDEVRRRLGEAVPGPGR
jgi:serine/threonine-protein kinase